MNILSCKRPLTMHNQATSPALNWVTADAALATPSAPANGTAEFDLLVVGGGINGTGIARDAVGRGLRVLLCEQDDLAQHTSSSSTKLIHGGLRYLEYYEFSLVRKALQEREVLLKNAPHIISPLRFVMPHAAEQRPAWMIRCGLFLYDHLAKREILPGSQGIRLDQHVAGKPLKGAFRRGFVYSDGWVDDARLVVLNALDAQERGAQILTRTRCTQAQRVGTHWQALLQRSDGQQCWVTAKAIVNAAGPWAAQFAGLTSTAAQNYGLRLIKGSHIIVPRMFAHDYAYIFQNPDQRIIFAIPYQTDYTLIGTTDLEYQGDPGQVKIDEEEINYLCEMSNRYFAQQIQASDVVWSYSGVRPLLDDNTDNASAITRDYLLELKVEAGQAALLNVWGGKITTYRKLSEEALSLLLPGLGHSLSNKPDWTDHAPLPGGDLESPGKLVNKYNFASYLQKFCQQYPFLPATLAKRLASNYGTRAQQFLKNAKQLADLGTELVPGLYEVEASYLMQVEWAQSAQDMLWRRSKIGLRCTPQHISQLQDWIEARRAIANTEEA